MMNILNCDRESLIIHIPNLPDRKLGPNRSRKQHWGTSSKLKTQLQHDTFGGIMAALQEHGDWEVLEKADVRLKIVNAKRRMDFDNCLGCLKYAFDCLQGKVIVNDSELQVYPPIEWAKGDLKDTGIWMYVEKQ